MSNCANNFIKMSIPVVNLQDIDNEGDKFNASQYVYKDTDYIDKMDMCVKKCNSGSIPIIHIRSRIQKSLNLRLIT